MNSYADVSIIVPFRNDHGHRERLATYVLGQIAAVCEDDLRVEVILPDDLHDHADLFNHGQAINIGAAMANSDLFVVWDADTTYDSGHHLRAALSASKRDRRWRVPQTYVQLTQRATDALVYPAPNSLMRPRLVKENEREWQGTTSWSGIVVIPSEAFHEINGYDERYRGWGADDAATALSLITLWGQPIRYQGEAVHLWHPRGDQETGKHRFADDGRKLTFDYQKAAGRKVLMQALCKKKRLS